MKSKLLVLGDGLLGSTFKYLKNATVLSKDQCNTTKKDDISTALNYYRPDAVINCAGIVPKNTAPVETIFKVNSFAPHYIADVCDSKRCKFIHISTDCVFSGKCGGYTEKDSPDAVDIYGMSKALGEPTSGLVVRTSFVGMPDPKGRGLLAWASMQDEIVGYDRVFWNGVTTHNLIRKLLEYIHEDVTGIRHVYSYTVSKYELLKCAKDVFGWDYMILPESYDTTIAPHVSNKTLSSVYETGFITRPIRMQLMEMTK